jgi:UDP-N-acetylglucosamine acyltransferase
MAIHPTAIIDPLAALGDVEIGPYCVVGPGVTLLDGVVLKSHVVVEGETTVGKGTIVHSFAVIGGDPQDLKYSGEPTRLVIGTNNTFREYATCNRGTVGGGGVTTIGDDNLFMASSHVGHDCVVGSGCVLANSAALAGHVVLGDNVVMGGLSGVHQHTRVGKMAMIGAGAKVVQDVPPFMTAQGDRARLFGVNVIGLRRAGYSKDTIEAVRGAYRMLFESTVPFREGVEQLSRQMESEEVEHPLSLISEFLSVRSKRGVCRGRPDPKARPVNE